MIPPVQIPIQIKKIIDALLLMPHPSEGGFYRETFRSEETVFTEAGSRSLSTSIYFLVLGGAPTELHCLPGPETFHYYMGDPLELFLYDGENQPEVKRLGPVSDQDARPQLVVPGGVWQAARVVPGGTYSLVGTTMSPGFDFADYKGLAREEWSRLYPNAKKAMRRFYDDKEAVF